MHVSEISFCDRIGFNIKSDDSKRFILNRLENTYNIRIVAKHFEHFHEKNMATINNNLHMICTRTNGNPYFLYLVKINYTNYCIFIDKKIQQGYFFPRMIIAHIFLNDTLFEKDIIFDGEMTKTNDGNWIYLINDLLVYNGENLSQTNLIKRINICYQILENDYKVTDTDIFKLIVKKYFKYDELDYLLHTFIPTRKYTCRGIYFKPLYLKFKDILVNFDDSLVCKVERVKYKNVKNFLLSNDISLDEHPISQTQLERPKHPHLPVPRNIEQPHLPVPRNIEQPDHPGHPGHPRHPNEGMNFLVKKTHQPDVYELFKGDAFASIAYIPNLKTSKKMRELFQGINIVTKININCEYSEKFKKWIPSV